MLDTTRNILVGTDFSASSERALVHAMAMARQLGVGLEIVHVVHPHRLGRDQVHQVIDEAEQLERLSLRLQQDRIQTRTHLRCGPPLEGLLDAIADLEPLLVVVGSHGRNPVVRALLGSVAEKLCQRSPAPVLVVPAEERVTPGLATEGTTRPQEHAPRMHLPPLL